MLQLATSGHAFVHAMKMTLMLWKWKCIWLYLYAECRCHIVVILQNGIFQLRKLNSFHTAHCEEWNEYSRDLEVNQSISYRSQELVEFMNNKFHVGGDWFYVVGLQMNLRDRYHFVVAFKVSKKEIDIQLFRLSQTSLGCYSRLINCKCLKFISRAYLEN